VMGNAAYGLEIVGSRGFEDIAPLSETAAGERSRVLGNIRSALCEARGLAGWHSARVLELPQAQVGNAGARALEAAVRAMPSPALAVSHLDLSECLLTDCGVTPILSLVRAGAFTNNMRTLDVSNNLLGDAGMRELAVTLPGTRITQLVCGENLAVTAPGWAALGAALPRIETRQLLVSSALGVAGIVALAEELSKPGGGRLEDLCLIHEGVIGDAGARALAAALPHSSLRAFQIIDVKELPGSDAHAQLAPHGISAYAGGGREALESAAAQIPNFHLELPLHPLDLIEDHAY